jgi:transposase-like protein
MARYSAERKESILKKLLPQHNVTVAEIVRQEHISLKTLYNWGSGVFPSKKDKWL